MAYTPKNYDHLIGTPGFGDQLLKNHFTLYQGYVTNVNKLTDTLGLMLKDGKTGLPEYAELKRRFGWEFGGMRLHELYFENMSAQDGSASGGKNGGAAMNSAMKLSEKMSADFGSYAEWEKDFKASGTMRGIGWTILYYDPTGDRLFNAWVNEHDMGHLAGCKPLLVLDVFEHAYMLDYGLKRADYIEAFFKAIDWATTEERFNK